MCVMGQPLRIQMSGGWYQVTMRGTERRAIFSDERGYRHFLELLEEMAERFRVRIHAYVLMVNHAHLVLETGEANLSAAMQWLKTSYAMWFNRREGRVGPLFAGRYKAVLFEGRAEAWPITRYVHLNPVRVKGLESGKRERKAEGVGLRAPCPEVLKQRREVLKDFPWSSYPCYAGWRSAPAWLQVERVLAGERPQRLKEQRQAYREYVESVLGETLPESPLRQAAAGLLYGSAAWVERMRRRLKGERREQKAFRELGERPGWETIRSAVERVKGEAWEQFAERHGDWGRDLALHVGRRYGGMGLAALGRLGGVSHYYTVAQALRRFGRRAQKDRRITQALREVLTCIKIQT